MGRGGWLIRKAGLEGSGLIYFEFVRALIKLPISCLTFDRSDKRYAHSKAASKLLIFS
jgi:hypothetical protein